jgi:hypothetical protein
MSVETKQQVQEELARSRRLLEQASDETTRERLRAYIEGLETKLLMMMGNPT